MRKQLFILFILLATCLQAQVLIRGPYLQSLSDTSVKIMWRTDIAANSEVWMGSTIGGQSLKVIDNTLVKDHIVAITGLTAGTKYFYTVKSDGTVLGGNDDWHHFTTSPAQGSRLPFRFWVLGDFGKRSTVQIETRNAYTAYAAATKPADFWLWLGDNAYDTGTDQEYQDKVFDKVYGYDSLFRFLPSYPLPGNHDYGSVTQINAVNHKGPYYNMVEVFKNGEMGGVPSGTENYYSFNWGNAHFICLNSEIYGEILAPANSRMMDWLKDDLAADNSEWKIVQFHQPPYSKGSHDSDDFFEVIMASMRVNFTPVFEQYGVDLVLCGHSHVYERSYLIKGHTGKSWSFNPVQHAIQYRAGIPDDDGPYVKYIDGDSVNIGTIYVVSGNGGSNEDEATLNHKAMYIGDAGSGVCGSLVVDVEGNRVDVRYLKSNGEIGDHFAVEKKSSFVSAVFDRGTDFDYLNLYPNPVNDKINMEWSQKKGMDLQITLTDISGKLISVIAEKQYDRGLHHLVFDLSTLDIPSGQYHINIRSAEGEALSRALIQFAN